MEFDNKLKPKSTMARLADNVFIKQIVKLLNVDRTTAYKIMSGMSNLGNLSKDEFYNEAKSSYDAIKMTENKSVEDIQEMLRKLYGGK